MKHFTIEQWIDYVRGVADPARRHAMEQHLSGGCPGCNALATRLRALWSVAQAELTSPIPEAVVRQATQIYRLRMPDSVLLLPRLRARLMFDSFREALPAGVRSGRSSRRLVYKAGSYSLELRQEQSAESATVLIVGQLADTKDPKRPLADVPAFLVSRRSIVARTSTNGYGEFEIEYRPARDLQLVLGVAGRSACIDVSVPKKSSDT
jgi:hypothetical protein